MRKPRAALFLTLLLLAITTSLGAPSEQSTAWHISVYVEPTLPAGVIPQFTVDLVEPAVCPCKVDVKQDLFASNFEVEVYPNSGAPAKPSHLLLRVRATGFSAYLLNTGTLTFEKGDRALVQNLHFKPALGPIPSVIGFTRLGGGASTSEVLEMTLNNPTPDAVSATRLAIYGWHNDPPDFGVRCYETVRLYTIELHAKGSQIFGSAKDAAATDLFNYPVQGSYRPNGCYNADSFGFDVPISATIPARSITRLRFDIRPERIIEARNRKEDRATDFLMSGLNWRLLVVLSDDLTLEAKVVQNLDDPIRRLLKPRQDKK